MHDSFGKLIRQRRLDAGVGLRELARLVDKSPGYMSDVEGDRVPPPSENVIIAIAMALGADKTELLLAACKADPELTDYVISRPEAADFLRMAQKRSYSPEDWDRLKQLAELSRLGKDEEE